MSAFLLNSGISSLALEHRRRVWIDGHGVGLLGIMLARIFDDVDGCDISAANAAAVASNSAACSAPVTCRVLDAFSPEARKAAMSSQFVVIDPLWAAHTGPLTSRCMSSL